MKKGVDKTNVYFVLGIIVLVVGIIGVYLYFFNLSLCHDLECFQENMQRCSRAEYISEEPEASWLYSVKGFESGECVVGVKLIQAKEGDLEISELAGKEMACRYGKGVFAYPEKDLSKCSGELKEEMQNIVIRKLHSYIVENLGQIDEEVSTAF